MALYGNLRNYAFMKDVDDIRGANIYGINDEKLGTIDDIIFDQGSGDIRFVVVDSGGWLGSKKFLVRALDVTIREEGDEDFHVNMTKDQIERLPQYDEESLKSENHWVDYEKKYQNAVSDGPVLHQQDSTHLITPRAEEVSGGGGQMDPERNRKSLEEAVHHDVKGVAHDLPRFGATSSSEDSTETGNLIGDANYHPRSVPTAEEYDGVDAALPREDEEPVTMSRDEFLKEGTLRSEYDAPIEPADEKEMEMSNEKGRRTSVMDSGQASVANVPQPSPEGGNRFRAFQERLRQEREDIMRRREQENKDKAA
jgi:sporulation protein YlmC with PRC-barrel domain